MKIIVLGAGLVGAPMAMDLSRDPAFEVTVADISENALKKLEKLSDIHKLTVDLSNAADLNNLLDDYDMAVNAVPGFMGFETLKAIIEAGTDVVDIAFFPEDPFLLDDLAKAKNVTAVVDCGVAPGMSNILVGFARHQLDEAVSAVIYVGGLPLVREWPYEYKAVFSPIDVIEEYVRPSRLVEKGQVVTRPALSDPEYVDFAEIGTLEAFNTDGLRSMIKTLDIPNMKEKTLRYPGHIEKMAVLRETGFFSEEAIEINETRIRPIDLTAKLLFPKWKLNEGEIDLTVMRIAVDGIKDGKKVQHTFELFDQYDPDSGIHSMARTTGYTATVVLRMIAKGLFSQKGICAPELIGLQPDCVAFLLDALAERGVVYKKSLKEMA
jgi:saccharopine dehydrogenase-like NADP-dependent oxidoreductase